MQMDFLLLRALKASAHSHSGHRVHASRRLSLPYRTIEGSRSTRFPGQTSATSGCQNSRQPGILLVSTGAVQLPAVTIESQKPYAGLSSGSSIILGLEHTHRKCSRLPARYRPMNNLLLSAIFFIGVGISALIHYRYVYKNGIGSLLLPAQFAATALGTFAISGVLLTGFADLWCIRLTLALAAAAGNVIGTRRARRLVSKK